jgi:hypothetical protein
LGQHTELHPPLLDITASWGGIRTRPLCG